MILASYNHAKLLPEAVRSVKAQGRPFDRIIAFSDGSQDDTLDVAHAMLASDRRVEWLDRLHENHGVVSRMREASSRVHDGYIMALSADDVYGPDAVELHERSVEATGTAWSLGAVVLTDDRLQPIRVSSPAWMQTASERERFRRVLRAQPWPHPLGWCYSAALLHSVDGFPAGSYVEDYGLALKFLRRTAPHAFGNAVAYARGHGPANPAAFSGSGIAHSHARTALRFVAQDPAAVLSQASRFLAGAGAAELREHAWSDGLRDFAFSIALWPSPWSVGRAAMRVSRAVLSRVGVIAPSS